MAKDYEIYYEEKTEKLLNHLNKKINKSNIYKVDKVENKIFTGEIKSKSEIDKAMK